VHGGCSTTKARAIAAKNCVHLTRANSSRARARGARRPSDVGQQRDPLAPRAALRGCWPPAQLRFSGFRFSGIRLGANAGARAIGATADDDAAAAAASAASYGVIAKPAALNDQAFRAARRH